MRLIEPRPDDYRMTSRLYLRWLASHAKYWAGEKSNPLRTGMFEESLREFRLEYRPINAIQLPVGEYDND